MKKSFFAGIAGNIVEYYDQALYAFLIPFLSPLFFPDADPVFGLLCAYGLLPLGLLSKPLGAMVFGWLGDRIGRKRTLSMTLFGMALATGSMGCLPTYAEAGWIAPTLLGVGRLLQNFFAGGETTGGALFLLEQTEEKRRGWISSLFDASGILGILLAATAAALWGESWRWLFLAGGSAALAGLAVRWFGEEIARPKPIWSSVWREWKSIGVIGCVSGYSYANYYLLTSFLNGFLPLVSKVSVQEALAINSGLLLLDFLLLPVFGWLTLRWEKERLMGAALAVGALCSLPLFLLLDGATLIVAVGVRIALTVIGVCLAAPYHAWAMEIAPKEQRYAVCAMGSAIGSRLIGSPMPVICLWLYQQTGWVGSAAFPLIAMACLAIWAMSKNLGALAQRRSAS